MSVNIQAFTTFLGFFTLLLSIPVLNGYSQRGEESTNPCSSDNIIKILKNICSNEHFSKGNCFDKISNKIDEMSGQDLIDGLRVMYYVCEKQ